MIIINNELIVPYNRLYYRYPQFYFLQLKVLYNIQGMVNLVLY